MYNNVTYIYIYTASYVWFTVAVNDRLRVELLRYCYAVRVGLPRYCYPWSERTRRSSKQPVETIKPSED